MPEKYHLRISSSNTSEKPQKCWWQNDTDCSPQAPIRPPLTSAVQPARITVDAACSARNTETNRSYAGGTAGSSNKVSSAKRPAQFRFTPPNHPRANIQNEMEEIEEFEEDKWSFNLRGTPQPWGRTPAKVKRPRARKSRRPQITMGQLTLAHSSNIKTEAMAGGIDDEDTAATSAGPRKQRQSLMGQLTLVRSSDKRKNKDDDIEICNDAPTKRPRAQSPEKPLPSTWQLEISHASGIYRKDIAVDTEDDDDIPTKRWCGKKTVQLSKSLTGQLTSVRASEQCCQDTGKTEKNRHRARKPSRPFGRTPSQLELMRSSNIPIGNSAERKVSKKICFSNIQEGDGAMEKNTEEVAAKNNSEVQQNSRLSGRTLSLLESTQSRHPRNIQIHEPTERKAPKPQQLLRRFASRRPAPSGVIIPDSENSEDSENSVREVVRKSHTEVIIPDSEASEDSGDGIDEMKTPPPLQQMRAILRISESPMGKASRAIHRTPSPTMPVLSPIARASESPVGKATIGKLSASELLPYILSRARKSQIEKASPSPANLIHSSISQDSELPLGSPLHQTQRTTSPPLPILSPVARATLKKLPLRSPSFTAQRTPSPKERISELSLGSPSHLTRREPSSINPTRSSLSQINESLVGKQRQQLQQLQLGRTKVRTKNPWPSRFYGTPVQEEVEDDIEDFADDESYRVGKTKPRTNRKATQIEKDPLLDDDIEDVCSVDEDWQKMCKSRRVPAFDPRCLDLDWVSSIPEAEPESEEVAKAWRRRYQPPMPEPPPRTDGQPHRYVPILEYHRWLLPPKPHVLQPLFNIMRENDKLKEHMKTDHDGWEYAAIKVRTEAFAYVPRAYDTHTAGLILVTRVTRFRLFTMIRGNELEGDGVEGKAVNVILRGDVYMRRKEVQKLQIGSTISYTHPWFDMTLGEGLVLRHLYSWDTVFMKTLK